MNQLLLQIISQQKTNIARLKKIISDTTAESIDSPGRNEVRYDARKEELARLAEAHDEMLVDEEKLLSQLESGKIHLINHEGRAYLLTDKLGGRKYQTKLGEIMLISKNSPIGQRLSKGV